MADNSPIKNKLPLLIIEIFNDVLRSYLKQLFMALYKAGAADAMKYAVQGVTLCVDTARLETIVMRLVHRLVTE